MKALLREPKPRDLKSNVSLIISLGAFVVAAITAIINASSARLNPSPPNQARRRLRRDADASKQTGETGIGAKRVPERLYFEVSETIESLLASLF